MAGTPRGFFTLAGGEAVARIVAFGTTIVLARALGPEMYGAVAVGMGLLLYLTQLADGGVELAGMPVVARAPEDAGAIATAALRRRLLVAAAIMLAVAPVALGLMPRPDGIVLFILSLGLPFTALSVRWVYLGLERPATVARSRIAGDLVTALLVVALVRGPDDVRLAPMATVLGTALTSVVMLVGLARLGVRLQRTGAAPPIVSMLERGRHLVLFTILGLLMYNIDLIILRYAKGEFLAGQYGAAYVMISFCANIAVAYAHTVMPSLARGAGSSADAAVSPVPASDVYASAQVAAVAVSLPVAVGGAIVAPALVAMLFGAQYASSAIALQILLVSVPLSALRELAIASLIAHHRERDLLRVNAISAVVNIGLNLALIPPFGLVGAAIATPVAEVVRLLLAALAAQTDLQGAVPVRRLGRCGVAAAGMWLVIELTGVGSLAATIALGAVTYGLLLILLGAIRLGGTLRPQWTG
ncbi:MAG: hypothetical protein MNPFHGCM_02093 [Gemmatimonadaceae bacterium]|nr:hypothetical protein [Gemmatimonadaceae bacterium]